MTDHQPPFERGSGAMSRAFSTLARFWWLSLPFALVAGGAGAWLASMAPTTYTAEVRLVVGGQALDAQTVPGFVFASQELAATYARYVDEASATGQLEQQVGVATADSITSITASPIPESSVIVIQVEGVVATDVQESAQAVADALVQQVASSAGEDDITAALAEFEQLSIEAAQMEVDLQLLREQLGAVSAVAEPTPVQVTQAEGLRAQVAAADAGLDVVQLRQEAAGDRYNELSSESSASLSVIRPAEVVTDDATTRLIVWSIGGVLAVLLVFLAVFGFPRRSRTPAWGGSRVDASSYVRPDPGPNETEWSARARDVARGTTDVDDLRGQDPARTRAPRRSP